MVRQYFYIYALEDLTTTFNSRSQNQTWKTKITCHYSVNYYCFQIILWVYLYGNTLKSKFSVPLLVILLLNHAQFGILMDVEQTTKMNCFSRFTYTTTHTHRYKGINIFCAVKCLSRCRFVM